MKRRVSVALAGVLVVGVVVAIIVGRGDESPGAPGALTVVRGVIGSEKQDFFADKRVVAAFAEHGLTVEVDPLGSREIATTADLGRYDFAFPSSLPAARKIQRDKHITAAYTPFSSPMAIATFAPIEDLLTKAGVVHKGAGDYQVLDLHAYLGLVARGTRWDQLPGNTAYPARRDVLVSTTDPRDSNSAAMYLSLTSFVANGDAVVSSPAAEQRVLPTVSSLFLKQGYTQNTTEGPFDDYLTAGMGKEPLVLVYESQFLSRQVLGDGTIQPVMRLLYPAPTVLSQHALVPLKPGGDQVGKLLADDPELAALAAEHGFRTKDPKYFSQTMSEHRLAPPASIVEQVDPPSYETLERLLTAIEKQYG